MTTTHFTPAEYEKMLVEIVIPNLDHPRLEEIFKMPYSFKDKYTNPVFLKEVVKEINGETIIMVVFTSDAGELATSLQAFTEPEKELERNIQYLLDIRKP